MPRTIIFIITVLVSFLPYTSYPQDTIRITNGEWPPYLSMELKGYGIASRIVTQAFAIEGIKVQYGFFPWREAFFLAENGDWDGTAVWLRSPERDRDFYLSNPVVMSNYVFFHLKSFDFRWKTIDDLKGLKIGATISYDYGKDFEAAEKEGVIDVIRVASDEQNLVKLLNGKIDIFPLDIEVGYTMLQKMYNKETVSLVTNNQTPLRSDPLHLLLTKKNKKNEERIIIFNRGLKKLKDKGEIEIYFNEAKIVQPAQ